MNRTHIFSLNGSVNGLFDICSGMGQSVKKGLDFAPHSHETYSWGTVMKGHCSAATPTFSLSAHFHPLPLLYSLTSGSWPPRALCPLPLWTKYLVVSLQLADVCGKYCMNKLYDYGASKSRHSKEKLFFCCCFLLFECLYLSCFWAVVQLGSLLRKC